MKKISIKLSVAVLLIGLFSVSAFSADSENKTLAVKSFDGFELNTLVEIPDGLSNKDVKSVLVYVHGSGPQNMDEDLSAVTVPKGTQNFFFRDIAQALLKKQVAAVRYNKRAYEVRKKVIADPKYKDSSEVKKFMEHPLEFLIKDASAMVDFAKNEFPNAKIYILGHSEGTGIALNVAQQNKNVSGVALIGFSNESITTSLLEQFVYRAQAHFKKLDTDNNGIISAKELKVNSDIAKSISKQMSNLDLNKDNNLSLSEFNAANYSNLILTDDFHNQNYQSDYAKLPRPSAIVKAAEFKVLFLQGQFDNQTPAYYTESMELVNKLAWQKKNLKFVYFAKAGHALDPRNSQEDTDYRVITAANLAKVSDEVSGFLITPLEK